MQQIQIALAAFGNGLTLVVVALLARDARTVPVVRFAIPLLACSIGYSLILLHETSPLPLPLLQVAVILNVFSAPLGWLFGRALVEDEFAFGWLEGLVLVVTAALGLAADLDVFGLQWSGRAVAENLNLIASLGIMAHVSWIIVAGFRDDLIETRRRLRLGFLTFVLLSYLLLILLDVLGVSSSWRGVAYDLTTTVVSLSILLWAARMNLDHLSAADLAAVSLLPTTRRQGKAYDRLLELMTTDHLYRQPGLSVSALADRVGVPPHRLRGMINGELGYRNFATFLNGYRLTEACAALADPDNENSILVIALDTGFQSLSTFNRAFRRRHDETPTEYRQRAHAQRPQAPVYESQTANNIASRFQR